MIGPTGAVRVMVATRPGARAPRYHRLAPQIQVCVALSTLLGLDEQPGELDGHGPIPGRSITDRFSAPTTFDKSSTTTNATMTKS